ncbi:glucose 1-dehydrogenase [Antarcticibacterium sp. 1MA-6-2]|uniref:SDR family NAD(P)-dependent oxidoreductase n=1 Tax=Antarcticibacterium sp. 1MA-6-2 TaxID=2908210 RepID=UPI001F31170E|nr:glucose 1-dehydrogenase [Antarcticibacterium sp. 1MA-6-2]UJH90706.1 glucose 1-dehydrogenase [Antarcticibacterium sp. 1MA-6-2]
MSLFSLKGKTAVITGGGSGIGKAIAEKFAARGATVHVLEYNIEEGEKLVAEIRGNEGKAEFHSCDVSKQEEVRQVISKIAKSTPINILVNNAGVAHVGNVENTTEEDMDRLYQVNIKGVYNCLFAVIPYMKKNGGGCIINMASIASVVGIADRFAYSMSKGAALTMTYSIAKDYLNFGIRCNSISPARVHTPFVDGFITKNYPGKEAEMFEKLSKTQPIGRMGTTEEIANLALYLCSDEASFITGTNFPIDGGFIKLNG